LPFATVAGVTVGRGAMGVSRNGGVSEAASAAGRLDEQPVISVGHGFSRAGSDV
jgi:hypothetical protein